MVQLQTRHAGELEVHKAAEGRAFYAMPGFLALFAALLVLVTLVQDYLETELQHSRFYWTESILFSSFWWLFVPFLVLQSRFIKSAGLKSRKYLAACYLIPFLLHLIAYPLLVWCVSGLFFDHQFAIPQTGWYAVSEFLGVLVVVYSIQWFFTQPISSAQASPVADHLILADGLRKTPVLIGEMLFIVSTSPYVEIHTKQRKFLHKATLKAMEAQLNGQASNTSGYRFQQIHKSCLVNLNAIQYYHSRNNGDYDLTLFDGQILRLSRRFAAEFKEAMLHYPRVTSFHTPDS